MASPPETPPGMPSRPMSALMRPAPRTNSRMSMTSKAGGGSRASDEDGKTSVKVAVRVRPPLKPSDPGYELIPSRFQRSMVQVTSPTSLAVDSPQGRKLFVFDRVFGEDVNQEGIWEYLVESTAAFVQGYNVSMLAYGQSGAGKSYTMGTSGPGEQGDIDAMGVIPRAAHVLFEKLDGPKATNRNSISGLRAPTRYSGNPIAAMQKPADRNWVMKATYVEIYNEQLRDLLIPEHVPQHERPNVSIREDVKGHILLTGLHQVEITSVDDLLNALNFGSMIRQTDSTAINAKSSRSHAVFSLNLIQRKSKLQTAQGGEKRFSVPLEAMTGAETMVTIDSKLHFVDLAGSERLKNTGAQGERAKEGISINAGLASLGKVISQLSSRQAGSHVSYRDSRLTRLLQDSLGGNAITYMIACVTPAEFHLSETLNTVQYAQRARAIQSKPKIQQVSDESDKQSLIDRLKAEVAFLREQIRSTERGGGDRRPAVERPERQNEREMELQNQLLDTQENYTALSSRHAKLISELAKARDDESAENQAIENSLGDKATERLKRSNSFAEAVESVVLEYEKTIQTLEQSLSSTRSTLSNTETTLLEKESKCAYTETVNQQLSARLQKMIDREASTENYLHDLEAKLDGHTSGEEKNSAIVIELRKEIARVRENEASCEDYISTLEERLAEADQDAELMQREIERLEHVVERQRSLGKLDNLLYELDHIQQEDKKSEIGAPLTNGNYKSVDHTRDQSFASKRSLKDAIPETVDEGDSHTEAAQRSESDGPIDNGGSIEAGSTTQMPVPAEDVLPSSPAQSKFVEDKLENVTQELFDLKVEHESTVNEFDLLSAKYEEALRTLAELQDAVDEARHNGGVRDSLLSTNSSVTTRPLSFLADARVNETKERGQLSSSRSLSSELSSAGVQSGLLEHSDAEATLKKSESGDETNHLASDETIVAEVENLKQLASEKDKKYAELEEQHLEALDLVEELKTEVSKAKMSDTTAQKAGTPVIRRKSSQNVMIIDRAHRSFASLRNIATDNFESNPDVMQAFEVNLNSAMHELHARSERIQELEADITSVKKEMETKMTIITGLTRERSSMKSSPMDISVVASMRDQLLQGENQMRLLQETHTAREKALVAEVEDLKAALHAHGESQGEKSVSDDLRKIQDKKIANLEAELVSWEDRHKSALQSMEQSEKHLLKTIAELERQMSSMSRSDDGNQKGMVDSLQKEINQYKASAAAYTSRVAELEQSHNATLQQLNSITGSHGSTVAEIDRQKALVGNLEQQIVEHENVISAHKDGLDLLHTNHANEIEALKASHEASREARINELNEKHNQNIDTVKAELAESRDELTKVATQVAFALGVDVSTEKLQERIDDLVADQKALAEEQKKRSELESHVTDLAAINENILKDLNTVKIELADLLNESAEAAKLKDEQVPIAEQLAILKKEMENLETKNKKNSRLVEELEDQLASNFDQHQAANNRLSTLQTERNAQLDEANANHVRAQSELEAIKEEYAILQAKFEDLNGEPGVPGTKRSNSNLRKSTSAASLPSPPPAIPLPPLPGSIGATIGSVGNAASVPVPPTPTQTSFGTRPGSKELSSTQIQQDQEARIKTIEKHLFAEKQLTATLEEALTDLERQSNKCKSDCDAWRRRAGEVERELEQALDREKNHSSDKENRWSLLQLEQEQKKRKEAEIAKAHLEERMNAISNAKKKKKGSLNCF